VIFLPVFERVGPEVWLCVVMGVNRVWYYCSIVVKQVGGDRGEPLEDKRVGTKGRERAVEAVGGGGELVGEDAHLSPSLHFEFVYTAHPCPTIV
jgi:hypothetical protein